MDKSWNLHEIIEVMRAGGYYDRIMSAGAELDRVKEYLRMFSGEQEERPGLTLQSPNYPCFPGLSARPYHHGPELPGTQMLEQSFQDIREEILAVPRSDYIRYAPAKMTKEWYLYLLFHMGVDMSGFAPACPRTMGILEKLPGICTAYPWGDATLSLLGPGSHLAPHCSVDNLRLRCHLPISVPQGCGIRVGNEARTWEPGKALVFDESFIHEVWNRGTSDRVVLIVDFWHPELTEVEIRALTAGFRKTEVRLLFYNARLHIADNPAPCIAYLEQAIAGQDDDPLIREYWHQGTL